MIEVTRWFGRFGNNILQVLRAIYSAEKLGHTVVKLPSHNLFIATEIQVDPHSTTVISIDSVEGEFFDLKAIGLNSPSTAELKRIAQNYKGRFLNQSFLLRPKSYLYVSDRSSVTCHIRGGDVFSWRPHPLYLQPPLYYYESLLMVFSNLYVVKEDRRNPVVKRLLKKNRVHDISADEIDDFSSLMHSTNLALSASTFSYAAYLLNDLVEKIFLPSYYFDHLPVGSWPISGEVVGIELPGYIEVGQWKNSFLQRRKLINFKPT